MATLFPDSNKIKVVFASGAEQSVYDASRKLSNGWKVFYSCTLSAVEQDEGLKSNEIDFVYYHPKYGIIVVEVKGGRIHYNAEQRQYFSINRYGEPFAIKDPFQQALEWKSRFVRTLKKKQIRVPVSHAVCLPSVSEEEIQGKPGITSDILIGRNGLKELENSLTHIAKMSHPQQYLNFQDVGGDIQNILAGTSYTSRLYLRDYLDRHDNRVKDFESIHESLLTPIASAKRMGIEGEAGTGKTMLAIMLAKHFRNFGKSVLLLTSNNLLNSYMQSVVGGGITVLSYTELASNYGINLLIAPSDFEGSKEDWIQYTAPELLKSAIVKSSNQYEVVICDEAQDVQPFWWEALESFISAAGQFYIFFDRSQGVFGAANNQFIPEEVLPVSAPYFPLVHNYRTTREIANFSRAFRTGKDVFKSHCGRIGYSPEIIIYDDTDDANTKLDALVKRLTTNEHLKPTDITLISARNPAAKESILNKRSKVGGLNLHKINHKRGQTWKSLTPNDEQLGVATIAGFKGLETSVGILLNVSEYNLPLDHPIMSSLVYVACTRAKHMLYVMVKRGDPKIEFFQKALKSVNNTGHLVIGDSLIDQEFSGTITHYNPDRVGWLKIEDNDLANEAIMFFPNDLKAAGFSEIKVGQRLRFRPRIEGPITIATDLNIIDF